MNEITCLSIGVVLWVVHVLIQGGIGNSVLPRGYLATARDTQIKSDNVYYGRATRALANYVENFAPFAALDLALLVTQHGPGWGPTVWIVARALYIPLYLTGVPLVRSAVWAVGLVGLIMMLVRLGF